ncbi:ABC transporter ATP-binding protein [Nakamurella leprariae]|uniref:ABC transporter ATP-binding protein n=1 Tax=Nakamurella leprariae TaxID=2803911 RepID=A0A938YFQ9_9ACTN|nr:ABC transporter ATP-binding protein [Nakamurella leprariae]MBM9468748.1 ABC transporter ATP-binding protein [Nakamurella leprariae]
MAEPLLQATGLSKSFGSVQALEDIDVTLHEGTIHGIVGPNGAGKTTLLSVMSGYLLPNAGTVQLRGRDITGLTPQRRVPLGVVRTFQNIRLFGGLSVLENVMIGQHAHARTGLSSLLPFRTASDRRLLAEAKDTLELFDLARYGKRPVSQLPYGVQKQLEMARAMATRPKVLLLDEPAAGMTTEGRGQLSTRIRRLRDEGVSVVIVEHDMDVIAKVCDEVTVLNFGRRIMHGEPLEVLSSAEVRTAYLGT